LKNRINQLLVIILNRTPCRALRWNPNI